MELSVRGLIAYRKDSLAAPLIFAHVAIKEQFLCMILSSARLCFLRITLISRCKSNEGVKKSYCPFRVTWACSYNADYYLSSTDHESTDCVR